MEVHHHSHTARKKWTHYFWEFLMLFLAVTLGFFVENWREHYIERLRVKEYARSLASDLARDTSNMRYIINRIKIIVRTTDSLATYVRDHQPNQIRNIDLFVLTAHDRYPAYRWSRSTLEQIKNSGSLRYFGDSMVRYISFYDAFSRHMDEDHRNDEEMANRADASKTQIIDMDYPVAFIRGLHNNIDSMINTTYFKELVIKDSTELLTKDIRAIKIFLNEKLNIRKNLGIRADDELASLKNAGAKLIERLKRKYHFD